MRRVELDNFLRSTLLLHPQVILELPIRTRSVDRAADPFHHSEKLLLRSRDLFDRAGHAQDPYCDSRLRADIASGSP